MRSTSVISRQPPWGGGGGRGAGPQAGEMLWWESGAGQGGEGTTRTHWATFPGSGSSREGGRAQMPENCHQIGD